MTLQRCTSLFAALLAVALLSPAAHAGGFLTEFLYNAGASLVKGTVGAASNAVSSAFKRSETPEQKAARQRSEIDQAAEQMLAQYPPEQREQLRPRVIERLNVIYAQHNAIAARQAAINEERNSVGGIVGNALVSGAGTTIGNRAALSAAGVAATHHVGAGGSRMAMDAAAADANAAAKLSSGGFDIAKMQALAAGTNAGALAVAVAQELRDGQPSQSANAPAKAEIPAATPPPSQEPPVAPVQPVTAAAAPSATARLTGE